ncbi:MAG: hypothetical protein JWO56_2058, partial [Acidobacteria bacterium]|nr:hypothetical protein [Acidobacteriota bacterium]
MIRNLFRIALFFAASSGFAATITVNSLSDGSGCSLRNAILAANTNAVVGTCTAGEVYPPFVDSIVISVTGTYAPSSALPAITEPADITATLPNFVLDGTGAGATTTGLAMSAAGTVRGLVIQNFGGYGVDITASGVNLYGNRIGTDPTATSAASNCTGIGSSGAGVRILSTATNVNTIEVGGTTQADHNVISGNQCHGVLIDASGSGLLSATVQGNYIGTTFCGCDAIPNSGYGVVTQGAKAHVVIGSQFPFGTNCQGRCNVIASNVLGQIKISNGLGTSVENNVIGANANMSSGLPADTTSQTGDGIL